MELGLGNKKSIELRPKVVNDFIISALTFLLAQCISALIKQHFQCKNFSDLRPPPFNSGQLS